MSDATSFPWLTDAEVDDMCDGLTRNAAKLRFLQDELKLPVRAKPNGRPLVPRWVCQDLFAAQPGALEMRVGPTRPANQPNEEALLQAMSRK